MPDAQPGPAEKEEDDAGRGSEKRDSGEEQLGAEHASRQNEHAADEDDEADNRRPLNRGKKTIASLPCEVCRNRDDEEAVRVVVAGSPVQDELRQTWCYRTRKPVATSSAAPIFFESMLMREIALRSETAIKSKYRPQSPEAR